MAETRGVSAMTSRERFNLLVSEMGSLGQGMVAGLIYDYSYERISLGLPAMPQTDSL
jgi:hypothetical protein